MQTSHADYFCLNILNTVALRNGEGKETSIFWEINLAQTIWLLCPSCIVFLTSSFLRISLCFPGQAYSFSVIQRRIYNQTGNKED